MSFNENIFVDTFTDLVDGEELEFDWVKEIEFDPSVNRAIMKLMERDYTISMSRAQRDGKSRVVLIARKDNNNNKIKEIGTVLGKVAHKDESKLIYPTNRVDELFPLKRT